MTWVALSGTHQVGKTTLVDSLGTEVTVVGGIMRELIRQGHPVAAHTTPDTIAAYVAAQQASEATAMKDTARHVVSDRVLVDGVAYVLAGLRTGLASYPWTRDELTLLIAAAKLHVGRYDVHVAIPIEFEVELSGTMHAGGQSFRHVVADELRQLLDDWPIPVVWVGGTVAERAQLVTNLLR